MARNWFPMRYDLDQDPAVVRMVELLKPKTRYHTQRAAKTQRVLGCLTQIWQLFDSESADGALRHYKVELLDSRVSWDGFGAAMVDVGWLEETPEGLVMPRFEKWLGRGAKRRLQDSEAKKQARLSASEADKNRTTVQDSTVQDSTSSLAGAKEEPPKPPTGGPVGDSLKTSEDEEPERGPFWKYASDESLWGPDPVDAGNGRRKRQGRGG